MEKSDTRCCLVSAKVTPDMYRLLKAEAKVMDWSLSFLVYEILLDYCDKRMVLPVGSQLPYWVKPDDAT